ncbi:hypothetical protein [Sandaracinus amylolyticus]|uniref:hypothetical protein n=1 Tax=Sandaracinus amylolyticus TaxID=927083 RepID=UPI001F434824|nr:hypothetical protein [Sandaracinus amylolyticus]UJR79002.1 ZU5 domain-containing protein [Sandaracinus amylolyticus]
MRSRPVLLVSILMLAAALNGCSQSHDRVELPALGETAEIMVGPTGGTITLTGVEITIPPGALASDRQVRVTVVDETPPSWLRPSSPILRFEPEGLEFDRPIEVRIPFTGDARTATVFWSQREGDAFVPRTTRIEGRVAIAESTHFSQAFVGSACEGDDCCDQANGQLDVVLMVDNSNSMSEEQAALAAQIPRLARALASGDANGDGVQDFPALESVRVGIVSSDMGVAGGSIPTCESGSGGAMFGDDGVLRIHGNTSLPGCDPTYPAFAEVGADSTSAEIEGFVRHVSCVGTIGTGGCGFEQQLESMLKAVTPATSPLRFFDDTTGHADGANAGFVRDESMLAVIMLTDEDDCSVLDPGLVAVDGEYASVDLNLRCHSFPEAVHDTQRYVDGLLALRDQPADVIFASVAGVPTDALVGDPSLDTILADARMQSVVDPEMPTRLTPSCEVPGVGNAFPPRRIVEVARDLESAGAYGVVGSICQDDFTPVIDAILRSVASRASGECN